MPERLFFDGIDKLANKEIMRRDPLFSSLVKTKQLEILHRQTLVFHIY